MKGSNYTVKDGGFQAVGLVWITAVIAAGSVVKRCFSSTENRKKNDQRNIRCLLFFFSSSYPHMEKLERRYPVKYSERSLAALQKGPGRPGSIKSMHCNVNWVLTLIVCPGSALASSAVTPAGLSKYGTGWSGERLATKRQVRKGHWGRTGIDDTWLSSGRSGHVRIVHSVKCTL